MCWSSADGEAYAAVWAIKHFRAYLYGQKFTLVTDSMAVRHLKTASAQDLHGKLARYALKLQQYDFDIVHRAGTAHGNVDGLSRLGHLVNEDEEEPNSAEPEEASLMEWLSPLTFLHDMKDEPEEDVEIFMTDGCTDAYRMAQEEPAAEPPLWFSLRGRSSNHVGQGATSAAPAGGGVEAAAAPAMEARRMGRPLPPTQPTTAGVTAEATIAPSGGACGVVRPVAPTQPLPQAPPGASGRGKERPQTRSPLTDASPAYGAYQPPTTKTAKRRLQLEEAADDDEAAAAAVPLNAPAAPQRFANGGEARGGQPLEQVKRRLLSTPTINNKPAPAVTGAPLHATTAPPSRETTTTAAAPTRPAARRSGGETAAGGEKVKTDPTRLIGTKRVVDSGSTPSEEASKKRLKRSLAQSGATLKETCEEEEDLNPELRCQICDKGLPASTMLICEHRGCGTGWHMECLDPPLTCLPPGSWYCPTHAAGGSCAPVPQRPRPHSTKGGSLANTESDITQAPDTTDDPEASPAHTEEVDEAEEELELEPSEGDEPAGGGKKAKQVPVWEDQAMLEYLLTGQIEPQPCQTTSDLLRELTRVRKRAARYTLEDDRLYKLASDRKTRVRVPQPSEREAIMKEAHDLGHFGLTKTYDFIRDRFWWEGMKEDIRQFVRGCAQCAGDKLKLLKNMPLRPLPIVPMWHRVHVDCMGPYKMTPRGNRFCILAVDSWSKYPEVGALPNRRAETVRTWFWQNWICRYGTPTEVLSDRGTEFCGALGKLLKQERIRHLRTSGYHPQTNGQAERLVGALLDSMRKLINDKENDWDVQIHQAAYAYRASRHATTGVSPAMCLFGRELTIAGERPPPIVEVVDVDSDVGEIEMTAEHYQGMEQRRVAMEHLAEQVEANTIKAKERNEQYYNARQLRSKPRQSKPVRPAAPMATGGAAAAPLPQPTPSAPLPGSAKAADGPSGPSGEPEPTKDDPLAHLPDLPENARVFIKKPRKTKTGSDREGPFFFDCWHPTGAYAQLRDRNGLTFSVAVHRLLVPPEFT
ncbi:hypothetical protein GPECTOR_528g522 [Gonium pectorale]|uniref:Integrase catalytic domain-containing protein n=1 Tax=Gonium pectorale TaxID=33097 RepID=A0A150FWE1_GONPE|nr:hypothetical protein GPECTOR_528g522 [Gonium pectorale]|eukprot:KXZ41350.1 hypothetical protein GPECTOR_528g522 [Gonium pectorale]